MEKQEELGESSIDQLDFMQFLTLNLNIMTPTFQKNWHLPWIPISIGCISEKHQRKFFTCLVHILANRGKPTQISTKKPKMWVRIL